MIIKHTVNHIDYILSNENLKVGDKVYPISRGRCCTDVHGKQYHIHFEYDFRDFVSGFPEEPHTILDLHYSESKPEEIRTDHGYGPIEMYYKIVMSLNKSDYYVCIRSHPKTNERCLFVADKVSYSSWVYIDDNNCFVSFKFLEVISEDDLKKLKEFRLVGDEYKQMTTLKFHKTYELTEVIQKSK